MKTTSKNLETILDKMAIDGFEYYVCYGGPMPVELSKETAAYLEARNTLINELGALLEKHNLSNLDFLNF